MIPWMNFKTVPEKEAQGALLQLVDQGFDCQADAVKDGMVTIHWGLPEGWPNIESQPEGQPGGEINGQKKHIQNRLFCNTVD